MVPLQMLDYLEFLLGSVGAVEAAERLLLGVGQIVMSESCWPTESLLAQSTSVWSIIAVLPLVGLQYETSLKGFATLLADVRACVAVLRVPVYTEGICSVATVFTLITGIWLLSCRKQDKCEPPKQYLTKSFYKFFSYSKSMQIHDLELHLDKRSSIR